MSDSSLARRAFAEIAFAGVDITAAMQPYFLSLIYTDTDGDDDMDDDVQIKLQDRPGIWVEKWLQDMIEAASDIAPGSAGGDGGGGGASGYVGKGDVTIRSGPGAKFGVMGTVTVGTSIDVIEISNGWASVRYNGRTGYVFANSLTSASGSSSGSSSKSGSLSSSGKKTEEAVGALRLEPVIVSKNWSGGGKDSVLPCGAFELDSIEASGPPDVITIKGTSRPYSSTISQTRKSKAWEKCRLSDIAKEIAGADELKVMYESSSDPFYARVEQQSVSDIEFLTGLCRDAGISLKVANDILALFDQAEYESNESVLTIKKGDGTYIKHRLNSGSADSKYTSCRVSYTDPATGKCISGVAKVANYNAKAKNNQQLEVTAKVSSTAEAMSLAQKRLRLHNKYSLTASFTFPGNPGLVAGLTVKLEGWGVWSGKYIIQQAKHSVSSSGYTTQIALRRCLEGY